MSRWLLRGLVFAAVMVIIRLLQGALINVWVTRAGMISIALVTLYAVGVFVWGHLDGRRDASANPDPDRRGDLAITWLQAGLFAGVVSGAVAWFIGLFYDSIYVQGLVNELTTVAAFTALLTFLVATLGVAIGRWLVDRKAGDHARRRDADDDRADTDVFAAVRNDERSTETLPAGATEEQTSAIAVAERREAGDVATDQSTTTRIDKRAE
jgi:hypothetical protein